MHKVIMAGFVVVIGMVVWAVMPPAKKTRKPAEKTDIATIAKTTDSAADTLKQPVRRMAKGIGNPAKKATSSNRGTSTGTARGQTKRSEAAPPKRTAPAVITDHYGSTPNSVIPKGAKRIDWPVLTKGEFAVKNYVDENTAPVVIKRNDPADDPFPQVKTASFKDTVRKFYGGLPANGRMPSTILAEDVLPRSAIVGLGIPPDSKLTMLGPLNTDDIKAFKNALAVPEDQSSVFGVSYVTPSGESHRKYMRLNIPE